MSSEHGSDPASPQDDDNVRPDIRIQRDNTLIELDMDWPEWIVVAVIAVIVLSCTGILTVVV